MKTSSKVALAGLAGLGLLAIIGRGSPSLGLFGLGTLFDRPQKMAPEQERAWQEAETRTPRGPAPKMMPAPDGSGRMVPVVSPVVGSVGERGRGHYG